MSTALRELMQAASRARQAARLVQVMARGAEGKIRGARLALILAASDILRNVLNRLRDKLREQIDPTLSLLDTRWRQVNQIKNDIQDAIEDLRDAHRAITELIQWLS